MIITIYNRALSVYNDNLYGTYFGRSRIAYIEMASFLSGWYFKS